MGPVVTLMMGRIEDWLRVLVERDGLSVNPDALPWSGIAVFKRAYQEFQARGFRARLLGAAIRHHYHWSELIGATWSSPCPRPGSGASTHPTWRSGRASTTRSRPPISTTCAAICPTS
jgi:hypothetical protein